jgi:chemotaxis signal transduction protein
MATCTANDKRSNARLLVFPARTPAIEGRQVWFLFSIRQVVEVLRAVDIRPVPFGSDWTEGIADWRNRVVPVLSLEGCLGIQLAKAPMPQRPIVIRSASRHRNGEVQTSYAIANVGLGVEQLALPEACEPIQTPEWVADNTVVAGAYRTPERLLLAVDMETILNV